MILADSSVWIDHLRDPDATLIDLLAADEMLIHPFVIGEMALGSIRNRRAVVAGLKELPFSEMADHDEVLTMIERHGLFGTGIGYVDAHLLAATLLTPGAKLWTRDRRLRAAANGLAIAADG